jgi:four helix bundle protein
MAVNSRQSWEYHLLTAFELKAITGTECETLTTKLVEVRKMLYGLIRSLSKGDEPDKPPRQS